MDMAITSVVFVKFLTWATIHIPDGIAGEITAGVIMVGMETMVGVTMVGMETTAGETTTGEITMVEILAEQQQEIISQVHAEM